MTGRRLFCSFDGNDAAFVAFNGSLGCGLHGEQNDGNWIPIWWCGLSDGNFCTKHQLWPCYACAKVPSGEF